MRKLQGRTNYILTSSGSKKNSQDPNTMDVNWIYLTPVQQAEHLGNNKCLICHKVGCSTRNHPGPWKPPGFCTYLPQNQQPHNIHTTNATFSLSELPKAQPIDEVTSYLNILCTNQNLSNAEILCNMQILFKETLNETRQLHGYTPIGGCTHTHTWDLPTPRAWVWISATGKEKCTHTHIWDLPTPRAWV